MENPNVVEKAQYDSTILIWSFVLFILTWFGTASSFFFLMHVFFPLLRDPFIFILKAIGVIRSWFYLVNLLYLLMHFPFLRWQSTDPFLGSNLLSCPIDFDNQQLYPIIVRLFCSSYGPFRECNKSRMGDDALLPGCLIHNNYVYGLYIFLHSFSQKKFFRII
jgi:hypothetical protein